jgi:hypothetical protein
VYVEAGQVLRAVQGATQLQVLDLSIDLDPRSKGQLVLGVQEALPGLTRLGLLDGAAGLVYTNILDTSAAVRPGLLFDLTAHRLHGDPYHDLWYPSYYF